MADSKAALEEKKLLDYESGIARVQGKKSVYIRMLKLFETSDEFEKLKERIEMKDLKPACNTAHAIKGMTANLGMNALSSMTEQLQAELKNEGGYTAETYSAFAAVYKDTLNAVKQLIPQLEQS